MKNKYLINEFYKTSNNLERLCVEAINLLRRVVDHYSLNYLYSILADISISPVKIKLEKSMVEIEKELYRIKIISREMTEKEFIIKCFEEKIKTREEGMLLHNLSGWRHKKLLKVQEEIMEIYRTAKKLKS